MRTAHGITSTVYPSVAGDVIEGAGALRSRLPVALAPKLRESWEWRVLVDGQDLSSPSIS